jgi:hypothetical protein
MTTIHGSGGRSPGARGKQGGYVLMITLAILAGIMAMGIAMMRNTASGRKIMSESRKGSQSRYAAESAIALIINRASNSVDSNGDVVEFPPTTIKMQGHSTAVSMDVELDDAGNERVDSIRTRYDLLTFRSYANIDAISTDTLTGSSAHIRQRIAFDQYPIFQFATYWEGTMDLDPGSGMGINGRIHCNARIKMFPWDTLSIGDWMTSPCTIQHMSSNGSSSKIRLRRVDGPMGSWVNPPNTLAAVDTPTYSNSGGSSRRMRIAYGKTVPVFKMPIGTRNAVLIIQPKGVDDKGAPGFTETTTSKKQKLIYKADLIFRKRNAVSADTQKVWSRNVIGGGDAPVGTTLNLALNSVTNLPPVGGLANNNVYDFGDKTTMDGMYIDVAKFFTKSTDPADQVIYLEGRFSTASPKTTRDVFVLYNAATLARPVTFVSNCPIYIWGNYNNRSTKSAAIIGDIITALSKNWTGLYNASTTTRTGAIDSVYACIMGGVRRARVHPTWNDPADPNYYDWSEDDNASYSDRPGQPHNHMCFMENFSGLLFTFSGSQVALWRCLYSTGEFRWNPTNTIYTQPNRDYSFDTRYNTLANMPPGTPTLISPFNLDYYEVHEE